MDYQEKEARLDIYDVKKALLYRKAIGETECAGCAVKSFPEVLELFIVQIVELYAPEKHKKDLGKEKQLKENLGVSISASCVAMNTL